jgi:hypothetical protein
MSLLDSITNASVNSALINSQPLSMLTTTSYAQAGTSLNTVIGSATIAAQQGVISTGFTNASLTNPVTSMVSAATTLDPSNATSIANAGNAAINSMSSDFSSNLSSAGLAPSLSNIQSASTSAISTSITNFTNSLSFINPSIVGSISSVGSGLLSSATNASNMMCSAAVSAATSSISNSVSSISNTLLNSASNSASSAASAISGVKSLIGSTSESSGTTTYPSTSFTTASYPGTGFKSPYFVKNVTTVSEDAPPDSEVNTTDLTYQNFHIYVEGVEVPFANISITQTIGQLPVASFNLPPQAGLMDIARYYQPKVHIFYEDQNLGGNRLLFWGHIVAVNYSKDKENGNASIAFECLHKNGLMQQMTFEWSAGGSSQVLSGQNLNNTNEDVATVQLNNFNSELSIIQSLQGITGAQSDSTDLLSPDNTAVLNADVTKLDARFAALNNRYVGMPASIMNMWNQVKRQVFSNPKLNSIFTKIFLPLVEDGIAFFDRMGGHYVIETQIQNSKQNHCSDYGKPEASKYPTMLPPAFRMNTLSAIQTSMAIQSLSNTLGFSGEFMTIHDLFNNFYYGIEYEMITMASPADVPGDPTVIADPDDLKGWNKNKRMAMETVIKPQTPFYYAPICNVLLPNSYYELEVHQQEAEIPTRITAISTAAAQATNNPTSLGQNYRAPQSIRESVAFGSKIINGSNSDIPTTLRDTTGSPFDIPGKYEIGRGVKHKKINMPNWLSHFAAGSDSERAAGTDEAFPVQGTQEYKNLQDLKAAWIDRYGYSSSSTTGDPTGSSTSSQAASVLNPYDEASHIMAYERLLFAAADYDYTKEVVKSKTGSVQTLFNPYIIPGYPMDILDNSPNHPSFHAMCASVTHTISPNFVGTTVNFMAAITYTEMYNYFLQPIHPWLQNALKLLNVARGTGTTTASDPVTTPGASASVASLKPFASSLAASATTAVSAAINNSTNFGLAPDPAYDSNTGAVTSVIQGLINNPRAKAMADQYYQSTLGVGCCDPSIVYDFTTGDILPVKRSKGNWVAGSIGSSTSKNGGEANDNLTGVGSIRLVSRPIEGKNAISDKFGLKFIDMISSNYSGKPSVYQNPFLANKQLLEPGASLFLDYTDIPTFIKSGT